MNDTSDSTLYRYQFGAARFDESRLELVVADQVVDLEKKPQHVLAELLHRVDEVVTRDELFDLAWGGRRTIDHVLTNAVAKLRRALGPEEGRIVTVPRIGYRFAGPVERVAVGGVFHSPFKLDSGSRVPGRPHFLLDSRLSAFQGSEVWVARHEKTLEPRVFKFASEGKGLTALKRESALYRVLRGALGERLDIARIIDWNFEAPPFYLECEFEGEDLARWAGAFAHFGNLTREQRIELFLQVVDAVDAAHSVGVLHKDLKPANILISPRLDFWQARVADFGSGRLLEPRRLAELGITVSTVLSAQQLSGDSLSGTTLYLAPELLAGQAPTVQSDVYALGMMLYQILTGDLARPLASGWQEDLDDALLIEDVEAATHGNPARRPHSAAELGARLRGLQQRRIEREQARIIRQRAENAERRLQRAQARRPWLITAVALLVAGVAVGIWQYSAERALRRQAEHETARAEAINRFLADDVLGAADPSGPGGSHNPPIRDVLERAAARLESGSTGDSQIKAAIQLALGNAYFGLSDYANAELYRSRAAKLLTQVRGPADAETLQAQYQLATVAVVEGKFDVANQLIDSTDRLAGSQRDNNARLAFYAHWARAAYYKLKNDAAHSLVEYQAVERAQRALDPDNASPLLRARDGISWSYLRLGQDVEAERVLRDFMGAEYPPQRVGPLFWAQARMDYAGALMSLKKLPEAEQLSMTAIATIRSTLGNDHYFSGVSLNELGEVYSQEGRWDQAADAYRQARDIMRLRAGETGQGTLIAGGNLGIMEFRTGRFADSVASLSTVYGVLGQQLGADSPQAQSMRFYLASALCHTGDLKRASELAEGLDAVALEGAEPRPDWPGRLEGLQGQILLDEGKPQQAVARLESAYSQMQKVNAPSWDIDPIRDALERAQRSAGGSRAADAMHVAPPGRGSIEKNKTR